MLINQPIQKRLRDAQHGQRVFNLFLFAVIANPCKTSSESSSTWTIIFPFSSIASINVSTSYKLTELSIEVGNNFFGTIFDGKEMMFLTAF